MANLPKLNWKRVNVTASNAGVQKAFKAYQTAMSEMEKAIASSPAVKAEIGKGERVKVTMFYGNPSYAIVDDSAPGSTNTVAL